MLLKKELKTLYVMTLYLRLTELKMIELNQAGIVPGHIHSGLGQEGAYAGVLATRHDGDYCKFTHRAVPACHWAGVPCETMYGEVLGKATGNANGLGGPGHIADLSCGLLGTSGALGCDTSISVGAALSARHKNDGSLVYSYYGDGTSSRGPVHEAMTMAGAMKLPILFVCVNNQVALSTNMNEVIPVEHPGIDRASAYGMESLLVNGTDVLAVFHAASRLTEGIRKGRGPAILEIMCKRWRPHFEQMGENQKIAVPKGQVCCVQTLETVMLKSGRFSKPELADIRQQMQDSIDASVAEALAAPLYEPASLAANLYAGRDNEC
jgi:TPP-dependent pyruvate/acetoin dehydrogenase alpha subunit